MTFSSLHMDWFKDNGETIETGDSKVVNVLEFIPQDDSEIFSAWAKHFRNHYCLDKEIDLLREGTGLSRKEFLNKLKLPTTCRGFGPGIRAGDFGEILVADYLEFILDHWVPRTRYDRKTIRNESTKGSDLIGFKIVDDKESKKDILSLFEVKTQFSGTSANDRLQDAVNDSGKDELRKAESLNAIKQRLIDKQDYGSVEKVARFQNQVDKPYTSQYGAVALFSKSLYDVNKIANTNSSKHPHPDDLVLIVITAENFMEIVNALYKRCVDEA